MKTHLTWSIEQAGKCPTCGGEPLLVCPSSSWTELETGEEEVIDVSGNEVSGHFCTTCNKLISLSLNTDC